MTRAQPYLAVYLLLRRGDEILMLKRRDTGHKDGEYGLPSGHAEDGENAAAALLRESLEEIGVVPENAQVVHVMHRNSPDRVYMDVYFEARAYSGKVINGEPHKCEDLSWRANPPEGTIDYVTVALRHIEEGIFYSEFGWG